MTAPDAAVEAPTPSKPMVPVLIAVVALAVGLGVGMKVVGPMVKHPAAAVAPTDAKAEAGESGEPKIVHVDNIIVNPMGTMGSRYLIMSVALEVPDAANEAKLHRADTPLRDAITSVLEKETMESLGRAGARESFKPIIQNLALHFAPGAKITVYIPQFLLQ